MSTPAGAPTRAPKSGRRRRPRRLLLFVHYNRWGGLADYVVYLLKRVRKVYARMVFISNSPLSEEARTVLAGLCDEVVERENTGFDFYAWKVALDREGPEGLARYDSVTLMNDTCFGPLFDLEAVYRKMEAQGADFWGITNHRKKVGEDLLATQGTIPEHIQSYFLCFKKETVLSEVFSAFWKNVQAEDEVESCIRKYETQLSGYLRRHGFSSAVLCDVANEDAGYFNVTIEAPDDLLFQQAPFIKLKAFFAGKPAENIFLLKLVREHSRYPVAMILDHLGRHYPPETSIRAVGHGIAGVKRRRMSQAKQRIALHIHAFYVDVLAQILARVVCNVPPSVDLFLTTDSEQKAAAIRELLRQRFPHLKLRALMVCENRGRDVWPWLQVAPMMAEYDIVGHLHTKKSPTATSRFSHMWREELLDSLLGHFGQIQNAFAADPRLGIVIPDLPTAYRCPPIPYLYTDDKDMQKLLPKVWERVGCQREVDFPKLPMVVFSYGNMFWYRPDALAPLWETPWSRDEIPEEPLPNESTLLHALERLPVYVAWERGYTFGIAEQTAIAPRGFQAGLAFATSKIAHPSTQYIVDHKATTLQLLHAKMRRHLAMKKG